jgi:hypothetical protein
VAIINGEEAGNNKVVPMTYYTFQEAAINILRDVVHIKHPPSMTDGNPNIRNPHHVQQEASVVQNRNDIQRVRQDSEIIKLSNGKKWMEYHPSFNEVC